MCVFRIRSSASIRIHGRTSKCLENLVGFRPYALTRKLLFPRTSPLVPCSLAVSRVGRHNPCHRFRSLTALCDICTYPNDLAHLSHLNTSGRIRCDPYLF